MLLMFQKQVAYFSRDGHDDYRKYLLKNPAYNMVTEISNQRPNESYKNTNTKIF